MQWYFHPSFHLSCLFETAVESGPSVLSVNEEAPVGNQGMISTFLFKLTKVQEEITSAADKLIALSEYRP